MNNNVWQEATAISTTVAVIVSLYFGLRNIRAIRKLVVTKILEVDKSNGKMTLKITIDNIGNRQIYMTECSFKMGKDTMNRLDLYESTFIPKVIKVGEVEVVEFHSNELYSLSSSNYKESNIYKIFSEEIVVVTDTLGNRYRSKTKLFF